MPTDDDDQEQPPASPPAPPPPGPGSGPPTNPLPPTTLRRGAANNRTGQRRQCPPAPPSQSERRPSCRRGAPHIADYNFQQPPRPAPALLTQDYDPGEGTSAQARANSSPISSDEEENYLSRLRRPYPRDNNSPSVPDPYAGHTPPDPNLAPCQCDPPNDPAAPCNNNPQSSRTSQQNIPTTPANPSNNNTDSEPVASRPGSNSNSGLLLQPQAVSPHPRRLSSSDLSRRKARPNYGPSLSAILKSHLDI